MWEHVFQLLENKFFKNYLYFENDGGFLKLLKCKSFKTFKTWRRKKGKIDGRISLKFYVKILFSRLIFGVKLKYLNTYLLNRDEVSRGTMC